MTDGFEDEENLFKKFDANAWAFMDLTPTENPKKVSQNEKKFQNIFSNCADTKKMFLFFSNGQN